jgi:hypothetical protein
VDLFLLRETRVYRADQVNSDAKVRLLWANIKDALGVEEHPVLREVHVDIQPSLFDDGTVTVTFGAWVTGEE